MSEENDDLVRRANAAFNSGDAEAVAQAWAPDGELRDMGNAPDQARVVTGRAAIQEIEELWTGEFEEFRAEVQGYRSKAEALQAAGLQE